MKKKTVALLLACVMALGVAIGGTMAWLVDSTGEVKNTFTVGDINITLTETGTDANGNKNYDFVPGDTLDKNPKVTVEANSEACYLFVKAVAVNNSWNKDGTKVENIIHWTVDPARITVAEGVETTTDDTAWQEVPNHTGYWYREVDATTAKAGASWYILRDNKVTVDENVTKDMVTKLSADKPALSFWAAAVQKEHLTLEEAFAQAWSTT